MIQQKVFTGDPNNYLQTVNLHHHVILKSNVEEVPPNKSPGTDRPSS